MAQMPDIKPEVNKEPEKKPGMLAGLFGASGSGSGAAGLGGLGGVASGGLLATKAGLLALIVVGSTVAGGIGLVGYKVFGPGESDQASQNIQLFAPKPKEAPADPNAAAAPKDGASSSLDNFAKVNSGALKGEESAASEAAPKGETADSSASAGAAAAAAAAGAVAAASGNGASTSMLKNTKKLGALSTSFGGGAGSAPSAGISAKAGDAGSLAAAAKGGQLGAMSSANRGAAAASSAARGISARSRRTGAQSQARLARDLGRQNQYSMKGAGKGFEGSSAGSGGETIGDQNAISLGGAGDGTGTQSKSIPASTNADTKEVEPPDPPQTYDVTPYKKELEMAKMLLMVAAGLLYYAGTLSTGKDIDVTQTTRTLVYALCGAAMAIGAYVTYLGVTIATAGKYGQPTQGAILGIAGVAIIAGAYMTMGTGSDGTTLVKAGGWTTLLAGAAGLIAMVGGMLAKPKTCKSTEPDDASKCTSMIQKSPGYPSERALEEYLT